MSIMQCPCRAATLLTWDNGCLKMPCLMVLLHLWCKLLQQSFMLLL